MQRAGLNHSSVEKFPVETLAGRSKIYFRPDRDGHNRATFPIRKTGTHFLRGRGDCRRRVASLR